MIYGIDAWLGLMPPQCKMVLRPQWQD